jgi:hypothetical protein
LRLKARQALRISWQGEDSGKRFRRILRHFRSHSFSVPSFKKRRIFKTNVIPRPTLRKLAKKKA